MKTRVVVLTNCGVGCGYRDLDSRMFKSEPLYFYPLFTNGRIDNRNIRYDRVEMKVRGCVSYKATLLT